MKKPTKPAYSFEKQFIQSGWKYSAIVEPDENGHCTITLYEVDSDKPFFTGSSLNLQVMANNLMQLAEEMGELGHINCLGWKAR